MLERDKKILEYIDREGLSDFLYPQTWTDIEGTPIGIFELSSDRFGVIFRIHPPFLASDYTEDRLRSLYSSNLPERSTIQMITAASNNINALVEEFEATHINTINPMTKEIVEAKANFLRNGARKSIFEKRGVDVRLTQFINLAACTITRYDDDGHERTREEVVNIFSSLHSALADFGPQKFTQEEYVLLMTEFTAPDIELAATSDNHIPLPHQVADSSATITVEENGLLGLGKAMKFEEIEELKPKKSLFSFLRKAKKMTEEERSVSTKWFARVFTTKMFPRQVSLSMLNGFFVDIYGNEVERGIPSKFISSLTVFIESTDKIKSEVEEKAKWNMLNAKKIANIAKFFPEVVERTIESEMVHNIIAEGEIPKKAMFSIVVIDDSVNSIRKYGDSLLRRFKNKGWILQEETVIPLPMFLYTLPLQFEENTVVKYLKRMHSLFDQNCAAITPVATGEMGFGAPVLYYVDRAASIVPVDLFDGETNKNFLVAGASGSGKSYLVTDIITSYHSTGAVQRVIDISGSHKDMSIRLGGQFLEFTPNSETCLNFFTQIKTDEDGSLDKEELKSLVPLVGLMAMQSISLQDASGNMEIPVLAGHISAAITVAFERRGRSAGLQDVLSALQTTLDKEQQESGQKDQLLSDLITSLFPFGNADGEYYTLFNGPGNLKFEGDLTVIDIQAIASNERLRSVVLASITRQIGEEFYADKERRKILYCEEIDAYASDAPVLKFIEGVGRRIRKHNGALCVITQYLDIFFDNNDMKAIYQSCPTKILLQQAAGSVDGLVARGDLSFSHTITTLLSTIKFNPPLYAEFMLIRDSGAFFIGRLVATRIQHWIVTQNEQDVRVLRTLTSKFNISLEDARLIQGSAEEKETSTEEEYKRRLKEGLLAFDINKTDSQEDLVEELKNI